MTDHNHTAVYQLLHNSVADEYELDGTFNAGLLVASASVSIMGAWGGVNIMEAFRTEKRKFSRQVLLLTFGFVVGGVSIWAMHFIGMNAFELHFDTADEENIVLPVRYDLGLTFMSFICAALLVYVGAYVASTDVFFGSSSEEAVSALQSMIELKKLMKVGKRIKFLALFKRPQRLIAGGVIAGAGVGVMHFEGMSAVVQQGFVIEWDPAMIVVSCLIAVSVATAGFWIVFRLLQWKPNSEVIRFGSAIVIAVAVCSMHYTGMTAATYKVRKEEPVTSLSGVSSDALLVASLAWSVFAVVAALSGLAIYARKSVAFYRDEIMDDVLEMIDAQLKKSRNYEDLQRNINKNIIQVLKVRTTKSGKSTHAGGARSSTAISESATKKSQKGTKGGARVVPSATPDTGSANAGTATAS
ncbi:Hypothetical Protein FCC1311_040462 [Hondaea fermentalgiana]|uniref:MHYT domain-containing protein n=1 Tax=Hondaea fermentalgiana TaxID=2315210 RepID=A0A2R5GGN7_9STRA|nr:Hypothetical Protein FCC1311_040462 [Hondaea fermentalgiana]|eukprot:GBG27823.1 Hypothetical Protein FCC1311_040462 [Hondaea fermentalgiana]